MYVLRPQFRIEEQRALAFAADRGFGVIVAADERGPRGSHVPFVIARRDDRVIVQIHLTARNPLVELADGNRRFLLIVSGDDAYISNDWYASPSPPGSMRRCISPASRICGSATRTAAMATHCSGFPRRACRNSRGILRRWSPPSASRCWLPSALSISSSTRSRDSQNSTSTRATRIMSRSPTSWRARRRRG